MTFSFAQKKELSGKNVIPEKYIKCLRSVIQSRPFLISLVSILTIAIVTFFGFVKKAPLVIFSPEIQFSHTPFYDNIDGGNSSIDQVLLADTALTMDFTIRKGFISPYVGVIFNNFKRPLDVTGYNRLHLEIDGYGPDNLFVYIMTKDKSVKDKSHRLVDRHSNVNLLFPGKRTVYNVPLSDFATPIWWFEAVNQSKLDFGALELDKLTGISLTTGISPVMDQPQQISIRSIYFYKDYTVFFLSFMSGGALIFLSFFMMSLMQYKEPKKSLEIKFTPTEVPSETAYQDDRSFLEIIHTTYHAPDLTLSKVSKMTGVPERVISKTISDQYHCNFKTYINRIRVEEAKRLLAASKLNISEIAYQVGFNSPSTFTKVFKKMTGEPPSSSTNKTLI